MRGEQAIFNLEIEKKSGLSINPDIHHSKVFSSEPSYCKYKIKPNSFKHNFGRKKILFLWSTW